LQKSKSDQSSEDENLRPNIMAAPLGNLFALGNTGGRPPVFKSPEEMEQKIKEYFEYVDKENEPKDGDLLTHYEPPTITGLCLFLGFSDLVSLMDYEKKSEEYSILIKRAKHLVMKQHELRLSGTTPTGSIFWLKNFGWKDTQQIDHTNNGTSFNHLTDEQLLNLAAKLLDSKSEE
jgi:hypothetical protein